MLIFINIQNSREGSIYQSRERSLYSKYGRESSLYSKESSRERGRSLYERDRSRTSRLPTSLERINDKERQKRRRERSVSEEYRRNFRREKRSEIRSESREIREIRNQEGNFTRKKWITNKKTDNLDNLPIFN